MRQPGVFRGDRFTSFVDIFGVRNSRHEELLNQPFLIFCFHFPRKPCAESIEFQTDYKNRKHKKLQDEQICLLLKN
jgi:hypothetical protein